MIGELLRMKCLPDVSLVPCTLFLRRRRSRAVRCFLDSMKLRCRHLSKSIWSTNVDSQCVIPCVSDHGAFFPQVRRPKSQVPSNCNISLQSAMAPGVTIKLARRVHCVSRVEPVGTYNHISLQPRQLSERQSLLIVPSLSFDFMLRSIGSETRLQSVALSLSKLF